MSRMFWFRVFPLLSLIITLTASAWAGSATAPAAEEEDDEVFRNRPFVSNRSTVPPPVMVPASQPTSVSTIKSSNLSQRTLDLLDGKTVEYVPVGTGTSHFQKLGDELGALIDSMDWGGGELAAYVEDAKYVIPILEHDAEKLMIPASCQKLLVAAAGLKLLGPDFQYETAFDAVGEIADGKITGNLIVRGSGDPSLSTRYQPKRGPALTPLRGIAKELRKKGVRSIEGHIIGDASAFDTTLAAPGWPDGSFGDWRLAEVSALTFNDNLIDFHWKSQRKKGSKPPYTLDPLLSDIRVENHVRIDDRPGRDWRSYERRADTNYFQVTGQIPPKKAPVESASIHKPEAFFVESFREALKAEGIEVKGLTSILSEVDSQDVATSGSQTLLVHRSAPLSQLIVPMIQNDQNLHAELLFKTLGKQIANKGSFEGGIMALETFKSKAKLKTPGSRSLDGSGLSRLNRMAPQQMVRVLKVLEDIPGGKALLAQLPKGGMPGLLQNRFATTEELRAAVGKVQGVAGFLPGTHTFAGSVVTANGRKLYFALMLNGSTLTKDKARENLDRLVLAMTKSPLPAEPGMLIPPSQPAVNRAVITD